MSYFRVGNLEKKVKVSGALQRGQSTQFTRTLPDNPAPTRFYDLK